VEDETGFAGSGQDLREVLWRPLQLRHRMGEDIDMKAPRITLRCDCGTEGMAAYGERWSCPSCGRTYDTSQIPASDYEQIRSLDRRFRLAVWAVVGVLAVIVLVVAITGQVLSVFAGLAVVLLGWFLYIKPIVHRRHRKAVRDLTRTWNLEAE
jgi:ribosomal protein S27AE